MAAVFASHRQGTEVEHAHRSILSRGTVMHEHWMQRCMDLAQRGAGDVSPNPMVGCVVLDPDGNKLGEGYHEQYGGPHAEVEAIRDVVERHGAAILREATLYVNLEPCSHHGKTPPCADLILEHGIPRVVVGMRDPHRRVAGRGIGRLREAGVDVTVGVLETACRRLNEAFVQHITTGQPLVTLKVAQTLDGQIATASGHSQWISSLPARTWVHQQRAAMDAVLVGSGTARADNPRLTVRHVEGPQPLRIILDRRGELPPSLDCFSDDHVASTRVVLAEETPRPTYLADLEGKGGRALRVPERDGHLDLKALFSLLGEGMGEDRPVQSVLVEAGPGLATALVREDLMDRLQLVLAPKLIGQGIPALNSLGTARMDDALVFADHSWEPLGPDMLFTGYVRLLARDAR